MVQTAEVSKLVASHPFFEGMDESCLALIDGCATHETFDAGQFIFHQGEAATKFCLLHFGAVALEFHIPGRDPLVLETLHRNEAFGWSSMVPPYRWAFDARAMELCRLLSLDAQCLREKIEQDVHLGYDLFSRVNLVMAHRLAAARIQLLDIYGSPSK
jgi:CRP-like cAMP-binding protein